MKIETINELLIDVVSKSSKITVRNPNQPILENVLFELIDSSTLRVTSYNLDIFYTQDIFIKTLETSKYNKICINPNILLSYLNLFNKNDSVFIEFNENYLKIKINNQESNIQTLSANQYPDIKGFNFDKKDNVLIINSDLLIDGIQSVSFSAALSSIKPEFSCVMMSINDNVFNFVATDGFRLAEKKKLLNKNDIGNTDDFKQVLVNAKTLSDLLKVVYQNTSISIFIEKGLFCIKTSESLLCVRTISGLYPDYNKIIPSDNFVTEFEIDTVDILNSLKASNIFSDDFNYVKIDIKDDFIDFYSKNNKTGESFSNKKIVKKGEDITQNYNNRYLSDFLNKVNTQKVIFKISGKTTPTVIVPKDDNSYLYMVMPMKK